MALIGIASNSDLRAFMESDTTPPPSAISDTAVAATLGLLLHALVYLSAVVLAGVLAMVWTWRVRVNAEALSPHQHARARGWAWAGWITPVVALWFPYQTLRDVDSADKAVLDRACTTSRPAPVAAWWGFYLAYWMIGRVAGEIPGFGYPYVLVYLASSVAGVVALLLFRRVVHTIQLDQERIESGSSVRGPSG